MSDNKKTNIKELFAELDAQHKERLAKMSPEERAREERRAKMRDIVTKHLGELDEKELAVIRKRFGEANKPHTMEEVNETLRVSRERIRQIEARAQARLQKSGRLPKVAQKPVTDN